MDTKEILDKFFQLIPGFRMDEVLGVLRTDYKENYIIIIMADMSCDLTFLYKDDTNFVLATTPKETAFCMSAIKTKTLFEGGNNNEK